MPDDVIAERNRDHRARVRDSPGASLSCDADWLVHYIETRFGRDPDGRMPADFGVETDTPDFILGRSTHGNIWRFAAALPAAAVRDLARLAGREPVILDPSHGLAPPERLEPFRAALHRVGREPGVEMKVERRGLFRMPLPADGAPLQTPATVVHLAHVDGVKDVIAGAVEPILCSAHWGKEAGFRALASLGLSLIGDLFLIG